MTIRYGIIGTGMMGSEHILSLRALEDVRIEAVVEVNSQARDLARAMLGSDANNAKFFNSVDELVESSLCDAVVIATPNNTHIEILRDLLGKDLHILVEKPLVTTIEDLREVKELSKAHQKIFWIGLEYRFIPAVNYSLNLVEKGLPGKIKMIYIREHRYPFLPKFGNWNRFNNNTGGTLVEKCCHFFDLMNLISRSIPKYVYGTGAQDVNHLDESYEGKTPDILDNAFVTIEYENNIRACLDLCMFAEASIEEQIISVTGDRGKIEAKLPSNDVSFGLRKDGRPGINTLNVKNPDIKYQGFHWGSTFLEHIAFIDAIKSEKKAEVSLDQGILSVLLGICAQDSIAKHKVLEFRDYLGQVYE